VANNFATPVHHHHQVQVQQQAVHVVDPPAQVHIEKQSFHGSQPQIHTSEHVHHGADGGSFAVHKQTFSDAQPDVHQVTKTVIDPKPVAITHGLRHDIPAPVVPYPVAVSTVSPGYQSPAYHQSPVFVSSTPSTIHEQIYHQPAQVAHTAYQTPHSHVEQVHVQPGVSIRKTHVDPAPVVHVENTFHDTPEYHGNVVKTTVVDHKPTFTVEKQIHTPGIPLKVAYKHVAEPVYYPVKKTYATPYQPIPYGYPRYARKHRPSPHAYVAKRQHYGGPRRHYRSGY
jgi:hypothetical protein